MCGDDPLVAVEFDGVDPAQEPFRCALADVGDDDLPHMEFGLATECHGLFINGGDGGISSGGEDDRVRIDDGLILIR